MNRFNVITPPEVVPVTGDIVFLNGPIQGAPDWQVEAINTLGGITDSLTVASPRKYYPEGTFVYERQVDWETHYRAQCHKIGVNAFWLAAQVTETPGRAYAQTSRVELGETMTEHKYTGAKMVVGIEEGFGNARYIKRRLSQTCPNVLIVSSLEDTCTEAVRLLGKAATA